jgi:hypothetical protein
MRSTEVQRKLTFGFVLFNKAEPTHAYGALFCGIDVSRGTCVGTTIPDFAAAHRRAVAAASGPWHLRTVARCPRYQLFVNNELILQFAEPIVLEDNPSIGVLIEGGSVAVTNVSSWKLGAS